MSLETVASRGDATRARRYNLRLSRPHRHPCRGRRIRGSGCRRDGPPDARAGAAEHFEGASRSSVMAGALSTYTLLGMGIGGVARRLAVRSRRARAHRLVGRPDLHRRHRRHRVEPQLLADRVDAVHLGIRHRRALQYWNAPRGRVRPDPHPDDRAGDASGRLVRRVRRRGVAVRVHPAAIRMAAVVFLRRRSRHRRVVPFEGNTRPAQLVCCAARRHAGIAPGVRLRTSGPIRRSGERSCFGRRRRLRCSSATTERIRGCPVTL